MIDPGDSVAIEQPTYPRAMQVFRSFGAQLLSVPWDGAGPRADVFERLLERHTPKLFYCQPSAHNPTGLAVAPETARRLLDAAARHQVPIVEDGFDGSLYYGGAPTLPLKAHDAAGSSSTSARSRRSSFRGCGWAGSSRRRRSSSGLQAAKQLADLHTSALIQAAVHRFCERRLLDRHATRVAAEYGRRRSLLLAALRRRMPPEVTWTEPEGGFSLLLTLPDGMDAATLLPQAIERGVAFTPGAPSSSTAAASVRYGCPSPRCRPAASTRRPAPRRDDKSRAPGSAAQERVERAAVPVV